MYVTIKERKLIQDSSVVLHNVVVEVDPQVFEVSNVEESDVVFEDAQVDVCDVLHHDDVKITKFVVNDSVVAGSHLTKNFTREVSPIAANKEARGETNHGDIVSSEQTQFLNGINSPFHTKDSIISVNIAHLNFRALIDTGDALPIKSQCRNISRISNHFRKIEFWFIPPKQPFGMVISENDIKKSPSALHLDNFRKVRKFTKKYNFYS